MATQLTADNMLPTRRWRSAPVPPALAGYPIFLLRPPYEQRDLQAALPNLSAAATVPGSVVGIQVHRPKLDLGVLRALVRDLSQRTPSCPVVVLLQMPAEEGVLVAARLAPLRLRAVVPLGESMSPILREALTDPTTLARNVVEWLRLRSVRLNPHQADLLEKLFAAAPEHTDVTSLLDHFRISQSTARFRLRKRGLASPSRWFQVARALHAALRLQARPDASTAAVAHQFEFADHSALAHLLRRSLGVQAREIRGTWGWEWLLDRWFTSMKARAQ